MPMTQVMQLTMPNGTQDFPYFEAKGVFFQAWVRTSKFNEKGWGFLEKKSAISVKQDGQLGRLFPFPVMIL